MAKVITRKPKRWFEFQMEEGGETYRVPLVQSLPNHYVVDSDGKFKLTAAAFSVVLADYIGADIVGEWTVEEVGDVFDAWDDACATGPDGVTTGE